MNTRRPDQWRRRIFLALEGVILLVAGLFPARALDPDKPLHQYNCRAWMYQNGLPVTSVQAIAQARNGCLWLGTRRGLLSFDGVEFTMVGLPPSPELRTTRVQTLCAARRGGVWFGLNRSGYGLLAETGEWRLGRDPQTGLDWDAMRILETRDGTLWVGGERAARGAADTLELKRLFPDGTNVPAVLSLLEDSKGRVWVGTTRRGLYCWQDGRLTKFPDPQLDRRIIRAIAEDAAGQIWLGTHVGLICYDGQLENKAGALPEYEVRCLLADRHGRLWVGTSGHGLVRVHEGRFDTLTRADGLTADTILSLAEDAEGNIWIGTPEGLNQLTDIKFPTYTTQDGFPLESALSVSPSPRGGLWMGTDLGAVYWNNGQTTTYSTNHGLLFPYVKRVFEATNGNVFIISGRSMLEVVSNGVVAARHETPDMPVAMIEDAASVIVSVESELYRVHPDGLRPFEFENNQKPALHWILNLANGRDGAIWVACVNGICRIKDGRFQHWTQADGLADSNARWVCEEADGTVWVGLATGIARLKDGRIHNLRQSDGLPDANLYSIIPDDQGWLWVDSLSGLYRLNKQNVDDYFNRRASRLEYFSYLTPEAVKPGDKQSQEATACRTGDGRIWFPGPKGMIAVDPAHVPINRAAPPVQLRYVRASGIELDRAKPIRLPPGQQDLEFSYTAFSLTSPRGIRFRYRLEGQDAEWIEAGERRLAYYANLSPGAYTFQVTACNADGIWNATGDSVRFELLPRFYQTLWFQMLAALGVVGGLAGFYGWRVRHLHTRQRQLQAARDLLETKVTERTAELVNEIEERKRVQQEVERVHEELMAASRAAGKAEVASSVLHNVGNVLNSVNVSTGLISERLRGLRVDNLAKAARLMEQREPDLARFLTEDPQGRHLPEYLRELARYLKSEQEQLIAELEGLAGKVGHIKEIVAMQQAYAKVAGVLERVSLPELVESALKMQSDSLQRHLVTVARQFENLPLVTVDKHKVLQILVNLIRNARQACEEGGLPDRRVIVRVKRNEDHALVEVVDNGLGIAPENLTRIFAHGFTTRQGGHGFGLHSAALAAGEMGGTLSAHSEGLGRGATFTLTLPFTPRPDRTVAEAPLPATSDRPERQPDAGCPP